MSRQSMLAFLIALPLAGGSMCATAQDASSAAGADARPSFFQHMLQATDSNGDGKISLDEFLAAATARFDKLDTGHTGRLTAQEIADSPQLARRNGFAAQRLLRRMGAGADGSVTLAQYQAAAKARFAKLDKNGDGFLEADEVTGHRWAKARPGTEN